MRWILLAAAATIAATLWWSAEAAQPAASGTAGEEAITFAQYRDWRNNFVERRRGELAVELNAANISGEQKAKLERTKAYYDGLAGLADAERDRRYRQRFDAIDTDHDGTMDAAERATWRDKRHALYRSAGTAPPPAAAAAAR